MEATDPRATAEPLDEQAEAARVAEARALHDAESEAEASGDSDAEEPLPPGSRWRPAPWRIGLVAVASVALLGWVAVKSWNPGEPIDVVQVAQADALPEPETPEKVSKPSAEPATEAPLQTRSIADQSRATDQDETDTPATSNPTETEAAPVEEPRGAASDRPSPGSEADDPPIEVAGLDANPDKPESLEAAPPRLDLSSEPDDGTLLALRDENPSVQPASFEGAGNNPKHEPEPAQPEPTEPETAKPEQPKPIETPNDPNAGAAAEPPPASDDGHPSEPGQDDPNSEASWEDDSAFEDLPDLTTDAGRTETEEQFEPVQPPPNLGGPPAFEADPSGDASAARAVESEAAGDPFDGLDQIESPPDPGAAQKRDGTINDPSSRGSDPFAAIEAPAIGAVNEPPSIGGTAMERASNSEAAQGSKPFDGLDDQADASEQEASQPQVPPAEEAASAGEPSTPAPRANPLPDRGPGETEGPNGPPSSGGFEDLPSFEPTEPVAQGEDWGSEPTEGTSEPADRAPSVPSGDDPSAEPRGRPARERPSMENSGAPKPPRERTDDGWKPIEAAPIALSEDDETAGRGGPARSEAGQRPRVRTHVVQRNENLWTIARDHYGDGRLYHALWEANADRVPAVDVLYIGTELVLPPRTELIRRLQARSSQPMVRRSGSEVIRPRVATSPNRERGASGRDPIELALPIGRESQPERRPATRPPEPPPEPKVPQHLVKAPNETLRSVARQHLGDPDRADEIYELNREKIRNPRGHLKPGLMLRLPRE